MDDFEKKIVPGILQWNHSNFFAYFGSGNAYPSLLGDMLSSGIGAIGFSWVRIHCDFEYLVKVNVTFVYLKKKIYKIFSFFYIL
jgi:hypothetical protein